MSIQIRLMLIMFMSFNMMMAQSYNDGNGTECDRYQITTKAELKYLLEN